MSANLLETVNTGLGRRTSQAPERNDFSKIKTAVPIPNLIEIQRESYNRFLQMDLLPEERQNTGLQSVFKSVFMFVLLLCSTDQSASESLRGALWSQLQRRRLV